MSCVNRWNHAIKFFIGRCLLDFVWLLLLHSIGCEKKLGLHLICKSTGKLINGSEFTPLSGHLGYSETWEGLKTPLELRFASIVPWIVEVACMEMT
jgi:hypothetical protein